MAETFDYIYEDEMTKLEISVERYINENESKGVSQMKGLTFWGYVGAINKECI